MDLLVVSGVVRCQLCHQPLLVTRSFNVQLRQLVCTNPLCAHYAYTRELSLYTQVPGQPTAHGT